MVREEQPSFACSRGSLHRQLEQAAIQVLVQLDPSPLIYLVMQEEVSQVGAKEHPVLVQEQKSKMQEDQQQHLKQGSY